MKDLCVINPDRIYEIQSMSDGEYQPLSIPDLRPGMYAVRSDPGPADHLFLIYKVNQYRGKDDLPLEEIQKSYEYRVSKRAYVCTTIYVLDGQEGSRLRMAWQDQELIQCEHRPFSLLMKPDEKHRFAFAESDYHPIPFIIHPGEYI